MANQRLRSFAADTLALVIFFTVVSGLNERFIAGMSWPEVATSRSIGAVLMVLTARPYGYWRDWFLNTTKPSTRPPPFSWTPSRCSASRCRFMCSSSLPAGQGAWAS